MKFTIIAVMKSLFIIDDYDKPHMSFEYHSEGLEYAFQGFNIDYPELKIINIF